MLRIEQPDYEDEGRFSVEIDTGAGTLVAGTAMGALALVAGLDG